MEFCLIVHSFRFLFLKNRLAFQILFNAEYKLQTLDLRVLGRIQVKHPVL